MHTHFLGGDNAFSAGDLFNMAKLAIESNSDEATAILVAPNGKIFALKVSNLEKATNWGNYNRELGEERMKNKYLNTVIYFARLKCAGACTIPEFHDLINNYLVYYLITEDTGLLLYEATQDTNGVVTGWNQVVYTP